MGEYTRVDGIAFRGIWEEQVLTTNTEVKLEGEWKPVDLEGDQEYLDDLELEEI